QPNNRGPIFLGGTISQQVAAAILGQGVSSFDELKNVPKKEYNSELKINLTKTTSNLESSDVIGVLPGTDKKDEYVFVTGHYDHLGIRNGQIYYGADDDGSGTTAVMEIAQTFAQAAREGHGPRRTMVFMTVSGEEEGLWGSDYYTNHPV